MGYTIPVSALGLEPKYASCLDCVLGSIAEYAVLENCTNTEATNTGS